jgi:hypothetical protein
MFPDRWFILATLSTALAVGAEPVRLGVILGDSEGLDAQAASEFRREVTRTFDLPGVALEWRRLAETEENDSFERLVVIRFRGKCSARTAGDVPTRSALGLTHASNGEVLPFVDIDCGRVASLVMYLSLTATGRVDANAFPVALARVAVHEIFHVLTRSDHHAETGLARAYFGRQELMAPNAKLDEFAKRRLQEALFGGRTVAAVGGY